MAGLGAFLAAGAAKGVGSGIVAEARARREAAISELENSRLLQREQASREFQTSERIAAQEFKTKEGDLDRATLAAKAGAEPPEVKEFFDDQGRAYKAQWNPTTRSWDQIGGSKAAASGGGVTISPDGTIQVGGDGGSKMSIPSGFKVDPNDPTRLTPIPGGPAEQIGGENAGRIGIAKSFLEDLDGEGGIREAVKAGGATGLMDAMAGKTGFGQAGQLYARIESGADALQRMLSGAGMPESEAQAYARRYMPSVKDSPEIVLQKLDRLEKELGNQMAIVTRGRGDVMGDGKKPDETKPDGNRTKRGVTWSAE